MSYSAVVYHNSSEGFSLTPIYPKLGLVELYLDYCGMVDDVQEIVIMKGRREPKIHGYYDWVNGKLKRDKSKPVMIHNFLILGD